MPRHLISDAHEWINEIPTVPGGRSGGSPSRSWGLEYWYFTLEGRRCAPATVPRAAPFQQLAGHPSASHMVMVEPPSHVNPPILAPPTVSPLTSSLPDSSDPKADAFPPFPPIQSSTASRSTSPNPDSPALVAAPSHSSPPPSSSAPPVVQSSDLFPPLFSPAIRTAVQPPSSSAAPPASLSAASPSPPLNPISSSSGFPPHHQSALLPSPPQQSHPSQAPTLPSSSASLLPSNPKNPTTPLPQSYAQATRNFKGPGFVRTHASDVESFARIPRTGVNIICGSKEGIPSFSFANSDLHTVEELYSNALVMKFHGGRPSLEASHREIQNWGLEHPFSIGPLSSRAFLLRFQDNKDLIRVLTRPSSILITFSYKIFRWHNLCHIKDDSCFAPVWISLPRLPLQCFIPEFLESVANKIGRFLCFDKATSTLARPSAARMCVELDLRKPPPPFIWVGLFEGLKQAIIYEKMPRFCNTCQVQGHSTMDCPKGQRETPIPPTGTRSVHNRARTQPIRQNATKEMSTLQKLPNPLPPTAFTPTTNPPLTSDPLPTTSLSSLPPPEVAPQIAQAESAIPNALHALPNPSTDKLSRPVHPNTPHKSPAPSHIPSIPPNPPPSSSQAFPTTLHPSPQAAVLPQPIQTSATISSSTTHAPSTHAPNFDHLQIQPTSTMVQQAPTAAAASFTPPAHSPLIPPSAAAPSPSDALLQFQPTAALLLRDSAAAATSAAPSADTQHQQTNIEVNKVIWEAVNRQVAILEQARLTDPAAAIKLSNKNQFSTAKSIKIKPSGVGNITSLPKKQAAALEQFKGKVLEQTRIRDLHLSNPTSMNHFQALRDDHSEADDEAVSYYSDTDEGCVEPIEMGYQSANGRSSSKPSGLKTNKRHPNMPLHVRLRSRKSSYPSTP